jgi:hypothetical protein
LAKISMTKSVDEDGVVVANVCVDGFVNAASGELAALPSGVGGFLAQLIYNPAGIQILEVRPTALFGAPVFHTQTSEGQSRTSIEAVQTTDHPQTPLCVAKVVVRLLGSDTAAFDLTLTMTLGGVGTGRSIPSQTAVVERFQRGDARRDGELTVGDDLFVAQYLAGLRELGQSDDPDVPNAPVHPVNAASIQHDDGGDRITIADRLLIAQRLVGLRNEFFNLPDE